MQHPRQPAKIEGTIVGFPWTFDTIRRYWVKGSLESVLGGLEFDQRIDANIKDRVRAIQTHFRQSFRINRRYTERYRDVIAARTVIDPITGARAPAAVWGQACIIPTAKGIAATRTDPNLYGLWFNIDSTPNAGESVLEKEPSPAKVEFIDRELGIFRLNWLLDPFGLAGSYVPCNMVDSNGNAAVPTRDLAEQDEKPITPSITNAQGTSGFWLANKLKYYIMVSMTPAAPNNRRQFERIEVDTDEIDQLFRTEFRIQDGDGPVLRVFVPADTAFARYIWLDDQLAGATISQLFGLNTDDPNEAGVPEGTDNLPGLVLVNGSRELEPLAKAIAASEIAAFADSVQGSLASIMPSNGRLQLRGNVDSASIQVAGAPNGTVQAIHAFPGQQQRLDRRAFLPESARRLILRSLPGAKEY